jgi:hypothetical protein
MDLTIHKGSAPSEVLPLAPFGVSTWSAEGEIRSFRLRRQKSQKASRQAREIALDAKFEEAEEPARARLKMWDFAGAATELHSLSFDDSRLAERLARRRDEVGRLIALKMKMIARINTAKPSLTKRSLLVPGVGGNLIRAEEKGIAVRLSSGQVEHHQWGDLTEKSVERLLHYTVKDNADDELAAGILLLILGDAESAERYFTEAHAHGATIDRYLSPLAAATFARAKGLLGSKQWEQAQAALKELETKYGKAPWCVAHEERIDATREAAGRGLAENEAEKLYAEASTLFEAKELFGLKPLVDRLKTDYSQTQAVTDPDRKPTFAEMAEAVATLGKFLTVRKDGKGDFTSIQAAIADAPPRSVVEIQDSGTYDETLVISKQLVLRGKKGSWPVVTNSQPLDRSYESCLVYVQSPAVTVEQIIIMARGKCLGAACPSVHVRRALLLSEKPTRVATNIWTASHGNVRFEQCVITSLGGHASATSRSCVELRDCIVLSFVCSEGELVARNSAFASTVEVRKLGRCEMESSTVRGDLTLDAEENSLVDCIIGGIVLRGKGQASVQYTNGFGPRGLITVSRAGRGCFSAEPQFRDAENFDYRLKPTSPCRRKARDGGDIGCRYTQEMLEMLKLALELRRRGVLEF